MQFPMFNQCLGSKICVWCFFCISCFDCMTFKYQHFIYWQIHNSLYHQLCRFNVWLRHIAINLYVQDAALRLVNILIASRCFLTCFDTKPFQRGTRWQITSFRLQQMSASKYFKLKFILTQYQFSFQSTSSKLKIWKKFLFYNKKTNICSKIYVPEICIRQIIIKSSQPMKLYAQTFSMFIN